MRKPHMVCGLPKRVPHKSQATLQKDGGDAALVLGLPTSHYPYHPLYFPVKAVKNVQAPPCIRAVFKVV